MRGLQISYQTLCICSHFAPNLSVVTPLAAMAPYNIVLLKDELSLSAWLSVGAAAQLLFGLAAPAGYVLLPVALTFGILGLDFVLQYVGLRKSPYLKHAVRDRHSILYRERDGSRPEGPGTKPVAMFLIGVRSNQ